MAQAAFKFELSGVKELMELLDQLPTVAMQKSVIRKALLKAGEPIAEAAKQNVPYDSKNTSNKHLRNSISVSTKLKASQKKNKISDRSTVEVYAGSSSPLAHLIEFGTGPRTTKKGAYRGQVSPQPFMRNAWDATKEVALQIFVKEMRAELLNAAKRLAKRAMRGTLGKRQIQGLLNK